MKHFLKETDFKLHEVAEVMALARDLKAKRGRHTPPVLAGQTWAMIFSKSSTRTRVSFEVGIHELGGNPLFLNRNDIQLGRGESIEDTARVLSRFVHGLIVRTFDHSDVERLAAAGTVRPSASRPRAPSSFAALFGVRTVCGGIRSTISGALA